MDNILLIAGERGITLEYYSLPDRDLIEEKFCAAINDATADRLASMARRIKKSPEVPGAPLGIPCKLFFDESYKDVVIVPCLTDLRAIGSGVCVIILPMSEESPISVREFASKGSCYVSGGDAVLQCAYFGLTDALCVFVDGSDEFVNVEDFSAI